MKHATHEALATLEPLLQKLRSHERLIERTPGAFYFKSKAFLHFHHDPSGIYADVKRDFEASLACGVRHEKSKVSCCRASISLSEIRRK